MTSPAPLLVEKTKHTLHLTRAALYLLEGVLQDPGPADTMAKTVLWAKVWEKIRKSNDRRMQLSWAPEGGLDFEKPSLKTEGESDIAFARRKAEFDDAHKAWMEQPVDLVISDKYRDVCRDALKWVYDHRGDPKARTHVDNSTHTALLLTALKLTDPIADEDE